MARCPMSNIAVPDATVLIEVLSPTTRRIDVSRKLADYFQVPSVQHSLILFGDRVRANHHQRAGDRIATRILADGDVSLDPPGITLSVASFDPAGSAEPQRWRPRRTGRSLDRAALAAPSPPPVQSC